MATEQSSIPEQQKELGQRDSISSFSVNGSSNSADIAEDAKAYSGENDNNLESGDFEDDIVRTVSHAESSVHLQRALTETERIEDKYDESSPIPRMGDGRDYPASLPSSEDYVVTYEKEDPMFPRNWTFRKKVIQCVALGFDTLIVSFGSSIYAEGIPEVCKEFKVAQVVGTLGVSLYVMGFASGPIVWGPASELYGRKPILVLSAFGFICFTFGAATAKDLQTLMICRFFSGCVGAGPLAVVPASFSDVFDNDSRGKATIVFSMAVFVGPMCAPIVGGFIAKSYLGWRWTCYLTGILGSAALIAIIFIQEESHHLVVLSNKAKIIRERTGNWGIHAAHDEVSPSIKEICEKNLTRPLKMLITEPILLLLTIYTAFVYGIMYLCLTAFPIIFQEGYGFSAGVAELPYIGLIIGIFIGGIVCIFFEPYYHKKLVANNFKPVAEGRLPSMMFGACVFPIGLFWLTWTGNYYKHIHWIVPTIGGSFIGMGIITIFIPALNYIVDCYLFFAASAVAGNTFLRSLFGGVFPLFATFMFDALGTNWSGLLIGAFACVLIPVPFLFAKYGPAIRKHSKYAFE